MKKIIIKHITFILSFVIVVLICWVIFVCNFFSYEIKKDIYPIISDSKQILTEVITKGYTKDKINRFLLDLKQSKKIFDFSVYDKSKTSYVFSGSNKANILTSFFNFSYPIKKNNEIIGYISVLPTLDSISASVKNGINIVVILLSVICLLLIFIVISYIYLMKYVFNPIFKIREIIEAILNQRLYDFSVLDTNGIWYKIFVKLKSLNTKIIDIKTAITLLFSVNKVLSSNSELANSIYLIFNMIQQKVNNSAICVLFTISDSGKLKPFAKHSFINTDIKSVFDKTNSVVWNCYKNKKEYIIEDINMLSTNDKKIAKNENIKKIIFMPLISDINNNLCKGVFVVGFKSEEYFDKDTIDTIREITKYFYILLFSREKYTKLQNSNRKLEAEIQTTSKELISTNVMLIQKIRSIKTICDIGSYASAKFDMEDIINYIVDKIKELALVETAGVFIYNTTRNEFYTVRGSFGISSVIKNKNIENTVSEKIFSGRKSIVLNSKEEVKQFKNSTCLDSYLNIKSLLAVPVFGENSIVAVLMAVNKIGMDFVETDVDVLEQLAIVVSSIIEKIKLYNKLKK